MRAVEHGQAKLEGLLEGLREAISGRDPRRSRTRGPARLRFGLHEVDTIMRALGSLCEPVDMSFRIRWMPRGCGQRR